MKPQMIAGIALLVVGVALFIVGMNATHSIADQVSNTFTGRFTQETMWYIAAGVLASVAGFVLLMTRLGRSTL